METKRKLREGMNSLFNEIEYLRATIRDLQGITKDFKTDIINLHSSCESLKDDQRNIISFVSSAFASGFFPKGTIINAHNQEPTLGILISSIKSTRNITNGKILGFSINNYLEVIYYVEVDDKVVAINNKKWKIEKVNENLENKGEAWK